MTDNRNNSSTFEEDKRKEAHKKRVKEEKTFTIVAVILYSVLLVFIVISAYIGVKLFITSSKEKILEQEKKAQAASEIKEDIKETEEEPIEEVSEESEEDEEAEEVETSSGEWVDQVFSIIENPRNSSKAPINTFDVTRMRDINDNDHVLDYTVYASKDYPDLLKVTTTENCGDLYEISDYYFANGKVNYISQYSEVIDIPVNLSTSDIQSRYYFANDKLVRYIYCENEKATEYTKEDFDEYSDGTKDQYDYLEKMMLDKAHTTISKINELEELVSISGYVLDEFNTPLTGINVSLLDKNGNVVSDIESNGDGKYQFIVDADDKANYIINISGDKLIDTNVYDIATPKGSKAVFVEPVYMAYENNITPYQTQIFVKDADDSSIDLVDADIKFRLGLNAREGEVILTGNLGEYGYLAGQFRSGNYTAEVTKDGYEDLFFNFVVKNDHLAKVAFAVKELKEGEIKAVLSFEANPLDLNIKCITSNSDDLFRSAVDSVGSTNAEVIDIINAGEDAYYMYVSDFTNIAISNYVSYSMSECNANVALYNSDGLVGNYPVPAGHAGIVWKPIEIRNKKVVITNDYYSGLNDNSIFMKK